MRRRRRFGRGMWSRRHFLRASIGSAAVLTGSAMAGYATQVPPSLADRLAGLVPTDSATAIGDAYLRTDGTHRDSASVVDALRRHVPDLTGHDHGSMADLHRVLESRARADFATDDVVRVHGWILARTEVLVCAVIALRRGRPDRS